MARHLQIENGLLSWEGHTLRLDFRCNIDDFGEISVDFNPVKSSSSGSWHGQWRLWHSLHRGRTRKTPFFHLSGETEDGIRVYTDYARLEGLGQESTPHEMTLRPKGAASELNIGYPLEDAWRLDKVSVAYLSRGQLGFPHAPVETPLGELVTTATAKADEATNGFGAIVIRRSGDRGLEEWVEACDDLAERVLNVLSLAQGRWLEWTSREVRAGDRFISQRIRPRELRRTALAHLFHHLNLGPVLKAAVHTYTRDLARRTGLDVALSWMLAPAAYIEGTFLNQMIALEQLVSCFERKARGLIPKAAFRKVVRPKLSQAIDELVESGELTRSRGDILAAKIRELNSAVFYDKVRQLIEYYQVPVGDIEGELKFVVVNCRNDLVHRGILHKVGEDSDLIYRSSDIAEELLKRIVMAMLGYRGQYISALYNLDTYLFKDDAVVPLNVREPMTV